MTPTSLRPFSASVQAGHEGGPGRPRVRRRLGGWVKRNRRAVLAIAGFGAVLVSLYFLPTGYLVVYPGPVKPMAEMVSVEGYPQSGGCLFMVLVVVKEANFYETVYAAVNPRVSLWSKQAVLGGRNFEEYSRLAREDMVESQKLAVKLALEMSGFPGDHGEAGGPGIRLDTGDIGGPSAGLMFFLEIASRLNPEVFRPPDKVAGTGILRPDGTILPVGGIEQKTMAARAAGIRYFIVPAGNEPSARKYAGPMKILPVHTCREALEALRTLSRR